LERDLGREHSQGLWIAQSRTSSGEAIKATEHCRAWGKFDSLSLSERKTKEMLTRFHVLKENKGYADQVPLFDTKMNLLWNRI
jgi:hypothetical protein